MACANAESLGKGSGLVEGARRNQGRATHSPDRPGSSKPNFRMASAEAAPLSARLRGTARPGPHHRGTFVQSTHGRARGLDYLIVQAAVGRIRALEGAGASPGIPSFEPRPG